MDFDELVRIMAEETKGLVMPNGQAIPPSEVEEELSESDHLIAAQGNHLDLNLRTVIFELSREMLEELRDPVGLPSKACDLDRLEQLSRIFTQVTGSADAAMSYFEGE